MGIVTMAFLVATCATSVALVEPVEAQQHASADTPPQSLPASVATTLEEALNTIDELLARLDASIEVTWARAEDMLQRADAATNSDEQLQLEELYGKMAAVAGELEARLSDLRALRRELAAAGEGTAL